MGYGDIRSIRLLKRKLDEFQQRKRLLWKMYQHKDMQINQINYQINTIREHRKQQPLKMKAYKEVVKDKAKDS